MSERTQHKAASLHDKMEDRYGDLSHKHNKSHHFQRHHWPTHPVQFQSELAKNEETYQSTGLVRQQKLEKFRKRLAKWSYH